MWIGLTNIPVLVVYGLCKSCKKQTFHALSRIENVLWLVYGNSPFISADHRWGRVHDEPKGMCDSMEGYIETPWATVCPGVKMYIKKYALCVYLPYPNYIHISIFLLQKMSNIEWKTALFGREGWTVPEG